MESSEWPVSNVFGGMTFRLGNWQECLLVSKYNLIGQYCLINVDYDVNLKEIEDNLLDWPDDGASTWDVIEKVRKF